MSLGCHPATTAGVDSEPVSEVSYLFSDLSGGQWLIASEAGEVERSYTLGDLEPTACGPHDSGVYCLMFQSRLRTALDGTDEVVFTYSALDTTDGSDEQRADLVGRFGAVTEDGAWRWGFRYLDFSQLEGGDEICAYDPADPCHPPDTLSNVEFRSCSLYMPHDFAITGEDEDGVALWVADTAKSRLLHVSAPREGDCAVVDDALSYRLDGWERMSAINSLKHWEEDGVPTLLFSSKNTSTNSPEGVEQQAGDGKGKIFLWQKVADTWAQVWEFPPASTTEESFVNTPHGVETWTGEDGVRRVAFAQSLGLSEAWGGGVGGSVTVLTVDEEGPHYVADLVPEDQTLGFPRDIFPLDAETWVVGDSGCLGTDCARPTRAWVIDASGIEAGEVDGVWTADHSRQNVISASVYAELAPDELGQIYSVEGHP